MSARRPELLTDAAHRGRKLAELLVHTGVCRPASAEEICLALPDTDAGFRLDQVRRGASLADAVAAWWAVQTAAIEAGKNALRSVPIPPGLAAEPTRPGKGRLTEKPGYGVRRYGTHNQGRVGCPIFRPL